MSAKRFLAGVIFVLCFSFSIGVAQEASEELVRFIDITSPANPVWSPDHNRLAYSSIRTSNRAASNIFVQDVGSGSVTRLTSGEKQNPTPILNGPRMGSRFFFCVRRWAPTIFLKEPGELLRFGSA